ncbi:nuclear transport factor 2 family protein [Leptospira selangorensis]|uniref:Nuclear transport factor 2 family protein n=1 Tax=Leptospira selangorensis TaxID=2484982 RepID=A0A4R9FWN3_9LEPT|nr:nuclear transport factor 2 family protein [Leptospira selangorensis]TGK03362.1 nuclear transport factor 2 family protein [Leptospira selangorensis]TGM10786.1 nuclear transport factor 2 family protein [Leptospira selangorensis]TGM26822.1 nuclear transport factor 2 family protein [Leptospira selangorensis]
MPTLETLEKFIAHVESNKHDEAIEAFYTADASMQENQSPPRVGRDLLVTNEKLVLRRAKSLTSKCIRPVFINGDYVVIRWVFHFDWKDGTTTDMEELAYQHWEGEKIKEEQFFYDPAQRIPK